MRWRSRRLPWWVVGGVLVAHLWLLAQLPSASFGLGAGDNRAPARIDVAFVRELAPSRPAPAPPPAAVAALPAPARAASAATPALPELAALPEPLPMLRAPELAPAASAPPLPPAEVAIAAPAAAAPAVAAAASAPASESFAWPPATRLSYRLTGDFRGPVEGQARVEWLLRDGRYQVHLDVSVGPSFAPLVSRRISSHGDITAAGLVPRRYDEETQMPFREPRRAVIHFDADRVRLPGGREAAHSPGIQDSASQFVQMTWLFTTRPELLQAGQSIGFALALPRHVSRWTYEVMASERLVTPVGEIEAVHVRPRREAHRAGDLVAEFWVAPTLQNLPVRIVIRQDEGAFVDLLLERLPQQAERQSERAPAPPR